MVNQNNFKQQFIRAPQRDLGEAMSHAQSSPAPQMRPLVKSIMLAACAMGLMFAAAQVKAQTPPSAGQVQRDVGGQPPALPKADPALPKAQEVRPQLRPESNFSMQLNGVRFSGITQILETDLQLLIVESLGKKIGFNELQSAADAVSNYYRGKGYFVARAYLPQQEIKDGIVEIAVLEGRVGAINVKQEGTVRTRADILQGLANANVPVGSIVNEKALERAALLANDLPGIDAGISLEPGAQVGDTSVSLTAKEGRLFNATVDIDNHGSRFTGDIRLGTTLNFNSPFGLGDQASLRLMHSNRELAMLRASYQIPVGNQGARLGIAASRVLFEVCCQLGFNPSGSSNMVSVFGLYPLERQRDRSIYLNANFDNKQQTNKSGIAVSGERELNVLTLGSSYQSRDSFAGGGNTFGNLSFVSGQLKIKDALGITSDASGPKAAGSFTKLGYQLSRNQRLSDRFSLYGGINGQLAGKNLDSAERFTLGGATGVRGYPGGEASGDGGYVAQIELRADLPIDGSVQWQSFLFYDYGGIRINQKPFGAVGIIPNTYELSSWGLGLNLAMTGVFQIRTIYAQKIGTNPGATLPNFYDADGKKDRHRIWFQAVTQF